MYMQVMSDFFIEVTYELYTRFPLLTGLLWWRGEIKKIESQNERCYKLRQCFIIKKI